MTQDQFISWSRQIVSDLTDEWKRAGLSTACIVNAQAGAETALREMRGTLELQGQFSKRKSMARPRAPKWNS